MNLSNKYPESLLKYLRKEELEIVSKLFNNKPLININIGKELSDFLLPVGGFLQKELTYSQIIDKILDKHNIAYYSNDSIQSKEEKILFYRFTKLVENLSEEEKKEFEKKILKYSEENGISKDQIISLNTISALTVANLSGFGMYLMASTVVGGLTSILGITLPFAFYTGMSSVLSVITGPIGWTVGLGYVYYSFKDDSIETATAKVLNFAKGIKNKVFGNLEHTTLIISFFASCRIILKEEKLKRLQSLSETKSKNEIKIGELKSENNVLEIEIKLLKNKMDKNVKEINILDEETFELELEINKINNFINHTQN